MYTNEQYLSIKDALVKVGMNPDHILHLEYKKSAFYLTKLIVRTERALIELQEQDGLDIISERQKSVQETLNQLIFAHNKINEMESIIYSLRAENDMLIERLKAIKL